jgi:HEAT repeat protein
MIRRTLPLVLLLGACAGSPPPPPRPHRTPRGPIPPAVLQASVLSGTPAEYQDPCILGMLLAGVDDARAGQRVDRVLLGLVARSDRSAREIVCTRTLAEARLLRLERLGHLDLHAELGRPEPEVRTVALLQIVRRHDTAMLPQVRDLIRDPQSDVATAAMRVLVSLHDASSVPMLQMLSLDPDQTQLHGAACRALWDMNVTDACGGRPAEDAAGTLGLSGSGVAADDPCAVARRDLKSTDPAAVERALVQLLTERFLVLSAALDPVRVSCVNCAAPEPCRVPTRTTRRIAREGSPWARALASAVLLLKDWPETP